jgi:hypothetical protein
MSNLHSGATFIRHAPWMFDDRSLDLLWSLDVESWRFEIISREGREDLEGQAPPVPQPATTKGPVRVYSNSPLPLWRMSRPS